MQIYGQLEKATYEILSADPSQGVQGRFWFNSTSSKFKNDDGTLIRAMLRNDQNCVFGNNATAASNIRFNRAAAGVLQFVTGDDTTAEGSTSTSLAKISAKLESYAAASKPTNGQAGRPIWVSDSKILAVDDGTNWLSVADTSTAQTFTNKTLTAPAVDVPLFTDQGSDPSAPASGKTTVYTKNGHVYKIANGGSATQLAEVGVTGNLSVVSKTGTYTATTSDDVIVCSSSSWTLTLYTAASGNSGKVIKILHGGTSLTQVYTLNTTSAQTIGGIASGSYALYTNGETLTLFSDGTNWQILDHTTNTDWISAGVLGITAVTTNPTKGTNSADEMQWRRAGNMAMIRINYVATGAGAAGSGDYLIALPGSMSFDTTWIGAYTGSTLQDAVTHYALTGNIGPSDGTNYIQGQAVIYDSTHFRLIGINTVSNLRAWGSVNNPLSNAAQKVGGYFWAPISGWRP